jgi:hypothetical protein
MDEFKDIEGLIRRAPAVRPPEDFTPRVMASVMRTRAGGFVRAWNFLARPRESALDPVGYVRAGIGHGELIWHFFIAGFVYALIGTLLLVGFSGFKYVTDLPEWISLQPFFWLGSALMFTFCGIVLYADFNRGLHLVRSYVLFHIGFAIINGISVGLSSDLPLTIPFAVLFAIPVMIIGSALFGKDKPRKFFTKGEIFSHAVQ